MATDGADDVSGPGSSSTCPAAHGRRRRGGAAVAAEAAVRGGLHGPPGPPLAVTSPMYEALTLATWWQPGHRPGGRPPGAVRPLRHPAVLARQCVPSTTPRGPLRAGLGSGSVPTSWWPTGDHRRPTTRPNAWRRASSCSGPVVGGPCPPRRISTWTVPASSPPLGRIPVVVGGASRVLRPWLPGSPTGGTCRSPLTVSTSSGPGRPGPGVDQHWCPSWLRGRPGGGHRRPVAVRAMAPSCWS